MCLPSAACSGCSPRARRPSSARNRCQRTFIGGYFHRQGQRGCREGEHTLTFPESCGRYCVCGDDSGKFSPRISAVRVVRLLKPPDGSRPRQCSSVEGATLGKRFRRRSSSNTKRSSHNQFSIYVPPMLLDVDAVNAVFVGVFEPTLHNFYTVRVFTGAVHLRVRWYAFTR